MTDTASEMLHDAASALDPLADVEEGVVKNRAKVGTARPSSLLYTYGPGAIMDLPGFSVMPAGLDDWEPIWKRREHIPTIIEPRLLDVVRLHLGPQVDALRPFPWQPKQRAFSKEAGDLGIPARVFPQWLRCTGCDYLGPLPRFSYTNTHPFRPDLAQFTHMSCPGRGVERTGSKPRKRESPAVPAQHLLTCTNGHLDEFPYLLWVHRGGACPKAEAPDLKMRDANVGKSVGSTIGCAACGATRGMAEAQGVVGRDKLPQKCRGRHPHLNAFDTNCEARPALIMMGASNLWFASTQSIIVMPTDDEKTEALADRLRAELGVEQVKQFAAQIDVIRALAGAKNIDVKDVSDDKLAKAVAEVLTPPDPDEVRHEKLAAWDPVEMLVPEWLYLQKPSLFPQQPNTSGLMVTEKLRGPELHNRISRVVAVNKMKKINAFLGFTRLDELDRVNDVVSRLVKLTRNSRPSWVPATEDRGEGIFLQLNLSEVEAWENTVLGTKLWAAHRDAHRRNFWRRFSETADEKIDPDTRLPAPRYWLLHTLSHVLIREMAMSSGYGAASLSERIYGWRTSPQREGAAGLLICTTASDSEGTLGGLVALSEPLRLQGLVAAALRRASRCSSDPLCAMRIPSPPEDFLHGAACHCCSFASETSCERANRFLDRRFLLTLPGADGEALPGLFGSPGAI
ncbi:hypothetical protein F0Q45_20790 [Mycobacterium simiae]|uniref:MrfA-like Zn-binding domain-containing protein n=1 Tax=Mycobacterium simiae TaxID=1784 RepID=A0A5B1BKA2_MYCSI|nr:DUF1998 domain-containing protein [Mycobacterium simiae]KAA1248401.1 hypothetical protein F0Q45_20790 [Mycobacterium simiae]